MGTGTGSFGAAANFAIGTNPYSIITSDFNGDAKADLATANQFSGYASVLLNCTGVGVNELKMQNAELRIWPNPANTVLNVVLRFDKLSAGSAQGDDYEVSITNVMGEEVIHTSNFVNRNLQIDVSSRPNGIYFISLRNKNEVLTKKIIINR